MKFTVIDIETTSANPNTTCTVELGAAAFKVDGTLAAAGSILVDPAVPVQRGAVRVHNIDNPDVAGKMNVVDAWATLPLKTRAVVAYNGTYFDYPVLRREVGPDIFKDRLLFDPFIFAKWFFRDLPSRALGSISAAMGVTLHGASYHSAADDCIQTGMLWAWMQAEGYVPSDEDKAIELQRVLWRALMAEEDAFSGLVYLRRSDLVPCSGYGSYVGVPLRDLSQKQRDNIANKKFATDAVKWLCRKAAS